MLSLISATCCRLSLKRPLLQPHQHYHFKILKRLQQQQQGNRSGCSHFSSTTSPLLSTSTTTINHRHQQINHIKTTRYFSSSQSVVVVGNQTNSVIISTLDSENQPQQEPQPQPPDDVVTVSEASQDLATTTSTTTTTNQCNPSDDHPTGVVLDDNIDISSITSTTDVDVVSGGWDHTLAADILANCASSDYLSILSPILATSLADHHPVLEYQWFNYWTKYIMDGVHIVHDETGLTYATCIVIFTSLTRIALIPMAVWSRRHEAYGDMLGEQIKALKEIRVTSIQMRDRLQAEVNRLKEQSQYKWQYRWIYPVTQTLAVVFMFVGLRQMCRFYPDEFETGGFWFFEDLTKSDDFYYLPILSFTAFLTAGELGADVLGRPSKTKGVLTTWMWRCFRVGLFMGFIYDAPAAVHLYWAPNSILSIVQSAVFAHPHVLKTLNIPLPMVKAGPQIYVDEKLFDPDPLKRDLQRNFVPVKLRSSAPAGGKQQQQQQRKKKSVRK